MVPFWKLSWGAAELVKLKEKMEEEGEYWTKKQIMEAAAYWDNFLEVFRYFCGIFLIDKKEDNGFKSN